jgi:hypothetical protein
LCIRHASPDQDLGGSGQSNSGESLLCARNQLNCHASCKPTADASDSLTNLLDGRQVGGQGLAVANLGRSVAAFGIREIEQVCGAALVGVLADVAALLRVARCLSSDLYGNVEDLVIGATGHFHDAQAKRWVTAERKRVEFPGILFNPESRPVIWPLFVQPASR